MGNSRHEHLIALLIVLAGLLAAATMLTVPPLFDPQGGGSPWLTATLGCAAIVLAVIAKRQRRNLEPVGR
jgi:hypothetical protein